MDKRYELRWAGLDDGPRKMNCKSLEEALEMRTTIGRDWARFTDKTPKISIWEVTAVQLEGV